MEYIFLVPIILMSIIIHEVSHGYAAYLLGDDTAYRTGRLSFNPIKHIDKFGTIFLPLILLLVTRGGLAFGYAKPVPINPHNFKDFKKDTALTAAAGPASNFIIAIIFSIIFRFIMSRIDPYGAVSQTTIFFIRLIQTTIMINLLLGLFNLIPFPPLDGSKVLGAFLSDELYFKYTAQERKGMMIFMTIMLVSYVFKLNIIGTIIFPPLKFIMKILTGI
ncbi:MAG: site-2 protease family protein [Candidatus Cloacimonetes bacterium]|nr:site-2 protease family protein [Candidatus Cloacimonadota bacterium]